MKIDTSTWKAFYLHELFDAEMGNGFDRNKMSDDNPTVNYVTRTAENNGVGDVIDYIAGVEPYPAGSITLALGGSIGSTFIQASPFYTGQNVAVLRDKNNLSYETKLFIVSIIKKECSVRFCAFGRELNVHYKTDFTLSLPTTPDGEPDWQWMEDYIRSLRSEPIKTVNSSSPLDIDTAKWDWFKLGGETGLFDIKKGKRLTAENQTDGKTPYVGAIDSNNGVSNRIGQNPIHRGNTISLSYNGSVGEAFYQPDDYWATDDVNALYLKSKYGELNPALALFICTVIKLDKYRFSYGRKWTLENMEGTMIRLPATSTGEPDWERMESYMKSLPYGDRIG